MAEGDSWDADTFDPDEPAIGAKKAVVADKWEGEDEDEDIKVTIAAETKRSEKKKLAEKIKEKESLQRKKQEELRKRVSALHTGISACLLKYYFFLPKSGVVNNVKGIDAVSPSSKDDFTDFEKLLKDKITPFESSIHYSGFLESLFRDLCLSCERPKKVSNSLTVLLSEKQKQEKLNKGKKKKKGVVAAGGMKAKMKDDLADYGEFDGGYAQDYEDFM
uniref:Eukaryotic translation initiation factor 3 30 kDa subunit n=1 Tax=Oncorhynchus tshawytscha TaxID=74940 RepID=A0A8C8BWQ9_ONCTS